MSTDAVILKKFHRYGAFNSHDLVKVIAIVLMVMDHIGLYFFPQHTWLRAVGRGAAPLFFFLVGYSKRHRFDPYLLAGGVFLTSLITFATGIFYLNILINFVLIKLFFELLPVEALSSAMLWALVVLLLVTLPWLYPALEYGSFGLLFAISAYLIRLGDHRGRQCLLITLVGYYLYESFSFGFVSSPWLLVIFSGMIIGLFYWLSYYRLRTLSLSNKLLSNSLMLVGRYSLLIYIVHLSAFIIIYYLQTH